MLRLKMGYTNYESFAFEFNLPRAQYGKYETGRADIRYSTLLRIVAAHRLSLREFFEEGFGDKLDIGTLLTDELEDKIIWHLNYLYADDPKWQATANKGMTLLERIEKLNDRDYFYLLEGLSSPLKLAGHLESKYNPVSWGFTHPHNYPGYPATPEKQKRLNKTAVKSERKPKAVKKKKPNNPTE